MKAKFLLAIMAIVFLTCCSCDKNHSNDISEEHEDNRLMVRYEKGESSEFFNVAVPDEFKRDIYYVFRLRHYNDHGSSKYMDLWRIDWAYKGEWDAENSTMTNVLDKILTDGESESVLKDYGQKQENGSYIDTYDFTGGFHGDERIDAEPGCGVTFYIDGEALTADRMETSFDWLECDAFHYVQTSTLHKTALKVDGLEEESDHHVIAGHNKTTVFGDGGYKTYNTLTMRDEIDFYWYFGICCVGTSVAEYGSHGDDVNMVHFDRQGTELSSTETGGYHAWSNDNGIEVFVASAIHNEGLDEQSRMHVWDTDNYAKYYRRYPGQGPHTIAAGEEFSSTMSVKFVSLW